MATKRQRRRREREHRHEFEFTYVDGEGNEVAVEERPVKAPPPRNAAARGKSGKAASASPRRGRAPQPPSWQRVAKRGAIFAPLFLVFVMLIDRKNMTLVRAVAQTAILLVLFVPFSYFLDSLVWKNHQKREGGGSAGKR